MARLARELAAQYGVSIEDLRADGKTQNKRLAEAREAYVAGIADGSIEDSVPTVSIEPEPDTP